MVLWYFRMQKIHRTVNAPLKGSLLIRAMISAAIDTDEALYTIVKVAAQSFLFLGGLQLNYDLTFGIM